MYKSYIAICIIKCLSPDVDKMSGKKTIVMERCLENVMSLQVVVNVERLLINISL